MGYFTFNYNFLVRSYNFNKKKFENSLTVSCFFFDEKIFKYFQIFKGKFFANFFFHFLDVSGQNKHFDNNKKFQKKIVIILKIIFEEVVTFYLGNIIRREMI